MGLVAYSDSEESDAEKTPVIKSSTNPSKPAFQKVVDRSNPGKIRVTLPGSTAAAPTGGDEPPTKRVKTGGGAFGGFNSFLPPPKRTGLTASSGLGGGTVTGRNGLAAGVSLKTGASPGFSREAPEPTQGLYPEGPQSEASQHSGGPSAIDTEEFALKTPAEEVKLVGKPMMFKPLSVSRNPKKKKATTKTEAKPTSQNPSNTETVSNPLAKKPRVSLFSVPTESSESYEPASNGEYKPLIYGAREEDDDVDKEDDLSMYQNSTEQPQKATSYSAPVGAQSLSDIASDMNLSAADRRQLFGRQRGSQGAANVAKAHKIINFNTDKEYQHNEELRAAGEQAVHNPVRAIAPGKHNLKQLVNAAASQKEALEESFAKGKSNRAEASSRYGW